MSRTLLFPLIFITGLVAMAWVAMATFTAHPLGAPVIVLIAACYLAGALELRRYREATATLVAALEALPDALADGLAGWLERLPPGLRAAVRQRVEGGRLPLPAPALTKVMCEGCVIVRSPSQPGTGSRCSSR